MKTKLNQSKLKLAIVSAMLLGTAGVTAPAYALDTTLEVSANIEVSCTISTAPVSFGKYEPGGLHETDPLLAQGGVTSTCTTGASGHIKLGEGINHNEMGTPSNPVRRMVASGDNSSFLNYGLFSDLSRSLVWESGTGIPYSGNGIAQTLPIYASVGPGQTSAVIGSYTDTVTVAINY